MAAPEIKFNVSGTFMSWLEGSDATQNPDTSGYVPTLGHKLNTTPSTRRGKGYTYNMMLTREELEDLRELAETFLIVSRDGDDPTGAQNAAGTIDRIDRTLLKLKNKR